MWVEKEICISEIEELLSSNYEVEVDSPDGYVPVSMFVDKGMWDEYRLELENGEIVRVNENHLFETDQGWKRAQDIWHEQTVVGHVPFKYLCTGGYRFGRVKRTTARIPIVDIQVEHENHRYYTNGVSSHNTGVGKSLFMCHMAAAALTENQNVLYITMEMAEERIAERIDANLLNVRVDELETMPKDTYLRKIRSLESKTKGKLIIKEYPTASASTSHFRALLNDLALKRNFMPDIIFVDYMNICGSARLKHGANVNSYSYIKAIAEELRGMAVEFDVPIVTATQTTRSGYSNSDPGMEDISESFGTAATVDFMISIVATEQLDAMNQILVKQLKNRFSDPSSNKRFVLGIDRAKMRLYDVAQTQLADSGQDDYQPQQQQPAYKPMNGDSKYEKFKSLSFD